MHFYALFYRTFSSFASHHSHFSQQLPPLLGNWIPYALEEIEGNVEQVALVIKAFTGLALSLCPPPCHPFPVPITLPDVICLNLPAPLFYALQGLSCPSLPILFPFFDF